MKPGRIGGQDSRSKVHTILPSLRGAKRRSNPELAYPHMDCFAEPVIGRRVVPTRWLAMTAEPALDRSALCHERPAHPPATWRRREAGRRRAAARPFAVRPAGLTR